jgi:putative membrane protein
VSAAPDPVPAPAPADPWHRVHPLTPVVKGWLAILVLAGGFVNIVLDDAIEYMRGACARGARCRAR